jgi:hypothetical protein
MYVCWVCAAAYYTETLKFQKKYKVGQTAPPNW